MEVQTWDSVFIRGTRRQLHPVIADVGGWGRWWPGLTATPEAEGCSLSLRAPGLTARRRHWTAAVTKDRPALGVHLRYAGDVAGEAEFYYLDEPAGTVVHYVLRGSVPDRRWRAAVRDHRAGVRVALHALKDRFERDRLPGDEPEPALLAAQQRAMREFAEAVAAARRKQAAEVQR